MTLSTPRRRDAGSHRITRPLEGADHEAERALLTKFADFWGNSQGDPRVIYDTPMAAGVDFEEVTADGVRGWWCRPRGAHPGRAILFLHGGSYVMGSATAYRGFASQIAQRTNAATFVLDYPLAPEHPLPSALDNAALARSWLTAQDVQRIAIVGDSAGGGLALAMLGSGNIAGSPPVVGCVVFSPWTDLALTGATISNPDVQDPLLTREELAESARQYVGGRDLSDPKASPLYGVPAELPPLYIQVGTNELLLDDAQRYAALAASRGGRVRLEVWEDLHHVFQLNVKELESSRRALDEAAAFLTACFDEHQQRHDPPAAGAGRGVRRRTSPDQRPNLEEDLNDHSAERKSRSPGCCA